MTPTSIQIIHELEKDEHTICKAIGERHIHELDNDCDEFHKQLTNFSVEFSSNNDVIPKQYYSSNIIDKPQVIKEIYLSKKSSRGPPKIV